MTDNRVVVAAKDANTGTPHQPTEGAMSEDRFRYVEAEPPLRGEERKRDYQRQYQKWYVAANREQVSWYQREYHKDRASSRRARQLAVAREYGATL